MMYNLTESKGKILNFVTHLTESEVNRRKNKLEKDGWLIQVEEYKGIKSFVSSKH